MSCTLHYSFKYPLLYERICYLCHILFHRLTWLIYPTMWHCQIVARSTRGSLHTSLGSPSQASTLKTHHTTPALDKLEAKHRYIAQDYQRTCGLEASIPGCKDVAELPLALGEKMHSDQSQREKGLCPRHVYLDNYIISYLPLSYFSINQQAYITTVRM